MLLAITGMYLFSIAQLLRNRSGKRFILIAMVVRDNEILFFEARLSLIALLSGGSGPFGFVSCT